MNLLKKLYSISAHSGSEDAMVSFLIGFCEEHSLEYIKDESNNLFITKGESESGTYPCLAAHTDEVHVTKLGIEIIESEEYIFGFNRLTKSYMGIGGDDKNGIWVALKCLLKYDILKVALFTGEEVGCKGSHACDISFFNNCRFVLQCDRRGNSDFINKIGVSDLCSEEFITDCNLTDFGYTKTVGMMTDVQTLKQRGVNVSCANMSCGYYNPHTATELTVKKDLINCLNFVQSIIENCTKVYEHKYVEPTYVNYGNLYNGNGRYVGYKAGGYSGYNGYKSTTTPKIYLKTQEDLVWEFIVDNWETIAEYQVKDVIIKSLSDKAAEFVSSKMFSVNSAYIKQMFINTVNQFFSYGK